MSGSQALCTAERGCSGHEGRGVWWREWWRSLVRPFFWLVGRLLAWRRRARGLVWTLPWRGVSIDDDRLRRGWELAERSPCGREV